MNDNLATAACPDGETLRAFESGRLSDEVWERCAEHVATCAKCHRRLDEASVDNGLAELLRDAVEESRGDVTSAGDASANDPSAEDRIGDYRLIARIGRGGMGEVYRAEHGRMRRIVAIKLLPASANSSQQSVSRFQREVEAAAKLVHRHVVTAYDAGEHLGRPFLVMEYVDGESLAEMVHRRGPLPVSEAVEFIRQTALALEYAHEQGVVHRDVKPGNILVNRQGMIKLLDLGLARLDTPNREALGDASSHRDPLTHSGHVMGTVDYMAPEQARQSRAADHRADLYSLGCTLHFLLTGSSPYHRESLLETMLAHVEQPIPDLKALRDDVVPELVAIHRRLLRKDREERFASATQLIASIDRLSKSDVATSEHVPVPPIAAAERDTISVRSVPTTREAAAAGEMRPAIRTAPRGESKSYRTHPTVVIAVGSVALIALLMTVIVVISRPGQSVTIVDEESNGTTIRVGGEEDAQARTDTDEKTSPKAVDTPRAGVADETDRMRSGDDQVAQSDAASRMPFARLSQTIGEIHREITRRSRDGEFGVPRDAPRMQQAANELVARWQRDGRLPKDQRIRIKYDANGAFSFTATRTAPADGSESSSSLGVKKAGGFGGGGGIGGSAGFGGGRRSVEAPQDPGDAK